MVQAYRDWKDLGVPDPGSGGPCWDCHRGSNYLGEWHLYQSKVLCIEQKSFSNKVWYRTLHDTFVGFLYSK
jgi:hypothetical protein